MLQNLIPKVFGWLVIIITLALAPQINTGVTNVTTNVTAATNASLMIGMTAVDDFAAPIIILGLLFTGGLLGMAGVKGSLAGAGIKDMFEVIGAVVLTVISLAMFSGSAIGYIDDLIDASTGFAQTIYGVIPIVLFIAIIGGATAYGVYKYRTLRKGKRRGAAAANY